MAFQSIVSRTLIKSVELTGVGLHSGETVHIKILPAEMGVGIAFVRTDLSGQPTVKITEVVNDAAPFRTVIRQGAAEVHTIEHLMSALSGLGVTDARIEIHGIEVPGMDGSALKFVEALQSVGLRELGNSTEKAFVLEKEIKYEDAYSSITALPYPKKVGCSSGLKISYTLDYPSQKLAQGFFEIDVHPESYVRDIAPARTFAIRKDAEAMRAAGLGKGANLQNTVVIDGDQVLETTLRFNDEPVRHKILDMIGDLSVLGCPLHAHIVAQCTGHKQNRELAMKIKALIG